MNAPLLSLVAPARNEELCLPALYAEIDRSLPADRYFWELIIVDDGSTDRTSDIIEQLAAADARVRGVHLARCFGQQAALLAGLVEARGDAVVTIDADLQQPPQMIAEMFRLWQQGFQLVHGVRCDHPSASWFKRVTSHGFYRVFRVLSQIPLQPGMQDFRLMDRQVVNAVLELPEAQFFLRGITSWVGFKHCLLPYPAAPRVAGKTKYDARRMFSLAAHGITAFSTTPLRAATYLGLVMTLLSLGYGFVVGLRHFFWAHPQPGYASTILLISFLMGVQFLLIGVLGEYVGHIHLEVKRRPRFIVARRTVSAAGRAPDAIEQISSPP